MIYAALVEGGELPEVMPPREWRRLDGVLMRPGRRPQIVEVDEGQHFNGFRATTLTHYPNDVAIAFPADRWLEACRAKRRLEGGGFARPRPPLFPMAGGRHRQRAFRDALADLLPGLHGFGPTIRIAEFDVTPWIWSSDAPDRLLELMAGRLEMPLLASGAPRGAPPVVGPARARPAPAGQSQRVTAADLRAGRIRLPASARRYFPAVRGKAEIVLRDSLMTVRYDPRTGPDRARSGVLSIGRAILAEVVTEGEVLTVSSRDGVVRLD